MYQPACVLRLSGDSMASARKPSVPSGVAPNVRTSFAQASPSSVKSVTASPVVSMSPQLTGSPPSNVTSVRLLMLVGSGSRSFAPGSPTLKVAPSFASAVASNVSGPTLSSRLTPFASSFALASSVVLSRMKNDAVGLPMSKSLTSTPKWIRAIALNPTSTSPAPARPTSSVSPIPGTSPISNVSGTLSLEGRMNALSHGRLPAGGV